MLVTSYFDCTLRGTNICNSTVLRIHTLATIRGKKRGWHDYQHNQLLRTHLLFSILPHSTQPTVYCVPLRPKEPFTNLYIVCPANLNFCPLFLVNNYADIYLEKLIFKLCILYFLLYSLLFLFKYIYFSLSGVYIIVIKNKSNIKHTYFFGTGPLLGFIPTAQSALTD